MILDPAFSHHTPDLAFPNDNATLPILVTDPGGEMSAEDVEQVIKRVDTSANVEFVEFTSSRGIR